MCNGIVIFTRKELNRSIRVNCDNINLKEASIIGLTLMVQRLT